MNDEIFERPYWVVDVLPRQVPAQCGGQFFAVEEYLLGHPLIDTTYSHHAALLLKLNCYYELSIVDPQTDDRIDNPEPEALVGMVCGLVSDDAPSRSLLVEVPSEHAVFLLDGTCLNMTLYDPTDELLKTVYQLAGAEGLFVWQPPNA